MIMEMVIAVFVAFLVGAFFGILIMSLFNVASDERDDR